MRELGVVVVMMMRRRRRRIMMVYDGDEGQDHDKGDPDDDAAPSADGQLCLSSPLSAVAAVAVHPGVHVQQPAARAHGV
jgi:hypothetical protein